MGKINMEGSAVRSYLKSEIRGWKAWELAWLALATAVILGLSLYRSEEHTSELQSR